MLNKNQIEYLCKISNIDLKYINGAPISISPVKKNYKIEVLYEEFKNKMGLEDLRFQGLCGSENMIAGGAVLNWVWGEHTNEDTDFFFLNESGAESFAAFLSPFGFHHSRETSYAQTYFNIEERVTLQLVNLYYGNPYEIMDKFDIDACKFVVDFDRVYTHRKAVGDLLELKIDNFNNYPSWNDSKKPDLNRILKYYRKGFFIADSIKAKIKIQK